MFSTTVLQLLLIKKTGSKTSHTKPNPIHKIPWKSWPNSIRSSPIHVQLWARCSRGRMQQLKRTPADGSKTIYDKTCSRCDEDERSSIAQIPLGSSRHVSTQHVTSASKRARWAVLFDTLDTSKMHKLDTSNVSCRVETWRNETNGIRAYQVFAGP